MKKAFKDSKWYWYIPILWFYFLPQISRWMLNGENLNERAFRLVVTEILILPNVFVIIGIIMHFFN
jgi:hypothetical protein